MNFEVTQHGVVSKTLTKEIRDFVEEGLRTVRVNWDHEAHRESFIEVIEDELQKRYEDTEITHGKVICDVRNNSASSFKSGTFEMIVQFRKKHAVIDTKLVFTVTT